MSGLYGTMLQNPGRFLHSIQSSCSHYMTLQQGCLHSLRTFWTAFVPSCVHYSLPGATTHVGSWPTQVITSNHLSLALLLQFLIPCLSSSLITPSIHLRFGLPTRFLPSGLSKVIYLHSRLSCVHTIYPTHLSLDILIAVTKSISSYRLPVYILVPKFSSWSLQVITTRLVRNSQPFQVPWVSIIKCWGHFIRNRANCHACYIQKWRSFEWNFSFPNQKWCNKRHGSEKQNKIGNVHIT